jgi:hypothetical protein
MFRDIPVAIVVSGPCAISLQAASLLGRVPTIVHAKLFKDCVSASKSHQVKSSSYFISNSPLSVWLIFGTISVRPLRFQTHAE